MSIKSPITSTAEWHRWERKDLRISTFDDETPEAAVDLTAHDLRWVLKQRPGSLTALLVKVSGAGIALDGTDDNIAVISVEVEDYGAIPPDLYYYELWDDSDKLQLSYGPAWLLPGTELEGS